MVDIEVSRSYWWSLSNASRSTVLFIQAADELWSLNTAMTPCHMQSRMHIKKNSFWLGFVPALLFSCSTLQPTCVLDLQYAQNSIEEEEVWQWSWIQTYANGMSLMCSASTLSSPDSSEDRLADGSESSWNVLIENQICLQEQFDLNRTPERGVGEIETEGGMEADRGRGRATESGNAVSHSWEQIGLKVTTPSMRWFSTEGNGAWVLSHKKQFIAKPTEGWEIPILAECQIFSATNCAVSGLWISTWGLYHPLLKTHHSC